MPQSKEIQFKPIEYTRSDYTALRAYCLKVPLDQIATRYYLEDAIQLKNGIESFLIKMRQDLIERAIENNPNFANNLAIVRKGGHISTAMLDILVQAADLKPSPPSPTSLISNFFKPKLSKIFRLEKIVTFSDLMNLIDRRGNGWWRSIPRLGIIRAKVILQWLKKHEEYIGSIPDLRDLQPATKLFSVTTINANDTTEKGLINVGPNLDGSVGINRSASFCFISAKNDLDAINFYLSKFIDRPHTFRSYQKELERFLLWSVLIQKKPMSSLLVEDCENYKIFLSNPSSTFRGEIAKRYSKHWKQFSTGSLSLRSQKYAITIIRAAFQYLVGVRYLAGNPWIAVDDPKDIIRINSIQIKTALNNETWNKLIKCFSSCCEAPDEKQMRIALAALLLLGDSGLRRAECVSAQRKNLKLSQFDSSIFELLILGKGKKERIVPVTQRTVNALIKHWHDRGLDFTTMHNCDESLIAPLLVSNVSKSNESYVPSKNYSTDGLYKLITKSIKFIINNPEYCYQFSADEIFKLSSISPHAFRHTFGTIAIEHNVPTDVVQDILGHVSSDTTRIYAKTRIKRVITESVALVKKLDASR